VPLSAGFREMNRKRDRRAERRVGGAEGMNRRGGEGLAASVEWFPDIFRSVFHLEAWVGEEA